MAARYLCDSCGVSIAGDDPILIENYELRCENEALHERCAALAARVADREEKLRERGRLVNEIEETL